MTAVADKQTGVIENPSGKDKGDENFPVGSFLVAKPLRRHVHIFYRFARQADDVADSPDLSPDEKLFRLDRMAAALDGGAGDDAPSAAAMRLSLLETNITPTHCHELLDAFRQDARKNRYASWDELRAYCRLSASPVGRYLLDLHGESRDTWPASDALCDALQVLNHLQDCAKDYRDINRVYLPQDWMTEEGATLEDLTRPASTPALRRVLDRSVVATRPLVEKAQTLAGGVKSFGLRAESAVIAGLADRLLTRLDHQDPLAMRVKLTPFDGVAALTSGVAHALFGNHP